MVLNDLCRQAFENKKIILLGNGGNLRDFIWMGDVCKIIHKITLHKDSLNDIYNLSSSMTYSVKDLAKFVQREYFLKYHKTIEIEYNIEDKNVYLPISVSNQKIKEIFNFSINDNIGNEASDIFVLLESVS